MSESIDITLARKLRYLRRKNELKQPELAEALGYKQQTISDLENGKHHFTDEIIDKIANYFKITAEEFEMPIEHVQINNSPNAHYHNNSSNNSNVNDLKLIEANQIITLEAMKAKDETIAALKAYIKKLESK
jgi:transcriptional regulator with XRE-family HTH domain